MCEKLLIDALDNVIHVNTLLEWIKTPNKKQANFERNCSQVEFISFFLNYIHEIPSRNKVVLKPKEDVEDKEQITPVKRRSALFENSVNNVNDSFGNHLSPLYRPNPVHKKLISPKTPPSICFGDFIRTDSKKKFQRNLNENAFNNCGRRINPTNVSQTQFNTTLRQTKNSFTFIKSEELVDFSDQRSYLAEERFKIISRNGTDAVDSVKSLAVAKAMNVKAPIVPIFELVKFREKLDILIVIYVFLLDNCLVINVTSELHFVVSVLLTKECGSYETVTSSLQVLDSIHNQIYFAARVLQTQTNFLNVLDKLTLRLLFENNRVNEFVSAEFRMKLFSVHENKLERAVTNGQEVHESVYFKCDTDNRNNFPSDVSFHNFRKQRDSFYEVLQKWESNRLLSDWNFAKVLGQKVKALFCMHWEPNNFVHFAKLFKEQLLMNTCRAVGEDQTSIISSMPNVDTEKLSRLNTRIVGKKTNGINALPEFTNYEEFYRDFVLVASSPSLNKHLIDAFGAEIVTMNSAPFDFSDMDEFNALPESVRGTYVARVKTLRMLAKFLGYLESLPYRSSCNQPEDVIVNQLQIRNQIQTTLNLKELLLEAIDKRNLTLTIPWLTKYLAMLDCVSLKLNYIKDVIQILFKIYYTGNYPLIIKLCLGWLFELPHFPNGLYYTWLSQALNNKEMYKLPKTVNTPSRSVDELNLCDQNIYYICCPYLEEFKNILVLEANATNKTATFKHITPITAVESSSELPNKRIQSQLEDAFFKSQPESVKKTVDFVSERIASGCVKEICYEIVPSFKKSAVGELRLQLDAETPSDLNVFLLSCLEKLHTLIDDKVKSMTELRTTAAMEALLASTALKQTKELCVVIAMRLCSDKVRQWVKLHVTSDIFAKDFDAEYKKTKQAKGKPLFSLPLFGNAVEHNPTTLSGVKLMERLRTMTWSVLEEPEKVTLTSLASLLNSIDESMKQRCDLNEYIVLGINKMLLDLLLLLITHRPDSTRFELVTKCSGIFKECSDIDAVFKTILSPRNIFILAKSTAPEATSELLRVLFDVLIDNQLLSLESIATQTSNLNQNTPMFIMDVVSKYKTDIC